MSKILRSTVEQRIQEGYTFKMGEYFSEAFQIFQKEWLKFSLYGLVSCMMLFFSALTVIGFILIAYPVMLGFSTAADKVIRGEELEFNAFFEGFRNIGQHGIVAMLFAVAYLFTYTMVFFFVFLSGIYDGMGEIQSLSLLGFYGMFGVLFLLLYAMQVLLIFTPFLIHYGDFSTNEAIRMSFSLVKKNFWWLLLFNILVGLISGLGQYLCLIGIFASIPIGGLMVYAMVKDVLFSNERDEIDEIGQSDWQRQ